jgi:hypothetical protein
MIDSEDHMPSGKKTEIDTTRFTAAQLQCSGARDSPPHTVKRMLASLTRSTA